MYIILSNDLCMYVISSRCKKKYVVYIYYENRIPSDFRTSITFYKNSQKY